jgi:hypothetical protein
MTRLEIVTLLSIITGAIGCCFLVGFERLATGQLETGADMIVFGLIATSILIYGCVRFDTAPDPEDAPRPEDPLAAICDLEQTIQALHNEHVGLPETFGEIIAPLIAKLEQYERALGITHVQEVI